jgi:hypothetical protein
LIVGCAMTLFQLERSLKLERDLYIWYDEWSAFEKSGNVRPGSHVKCRLYRIDTDGSRTRPTMFSVRPSTPNFIEICSVVSEMQQSDKLDLRCVRSFRALQLIVLP